MSVFVNIPPVSNININPMTASYQFAKPAEPSVRHIPKKLTNDTFERTSMTIDEKSKVSDPIAVQYAPVASEIKSTLTTLKSLQVKADTTFQKQQMVNGWISRFSDKLSVLWGSKNRASLVEDDLQMNRHYIENLDAAAREGNFRAEFYKTYGVNYNREKIEAFDKQSAKYTSIKVAEQIAEQADEKLGGFVKYFEKNRNSINPESPNFDPYAKHAPIASKFEEYQAELEKFVGGKENLQKFAALKRSYFPVASREEQIEVYNEIALGLIHTYDTTAQKLKEGKTDKEIQKEYDQAYKEAFGEKNNIQKRVSDYVKAQQIRTVVVEDFAVAGLIGAVIGLTGPASPALVGAGLSTASYIGLDLSELATNKIDNSIDMDKEAVKDVIKCSAIVGLEYFVGTKLYDVVPEIKTGKKVLDSALDVARTLGIELSTAFVSEYAQTGEWATYQTDPKSFIKSTLATFAIEELVVMGLKSALTSQPTGNSISSKSMKKFTDAANIELEKQFRKNPAKVMNLKLISIENPELFQQLMTTTLQEMV